jgi:hypothetical protein
VVETRMDRPRPGDPAALTGNDARSDRGDPACDGRLSATTAGRSATVDGKSPPRSAGPDASRLRLVAGKSDAGSGKSKPKSSGISGHDGIDWRAAATAAFPIRGARCSADTIGRSDSCREPSAAGKSEGSSVRSCGGAGSRNDCGAGSGSAGGATPAIVWTGARCGSRAGGTGLRGARGAASEATDTGRGGTPGRGGDTGGFCVGAGATATTGAAGRMGATATTGAAGRTGATATTGAAGRTGATAASLGGDGTWAGAAGSTGRGAAVPGTVTTNE